jgi:hypothetical protein
MRMAAIQCKQILEWFTSGERRGVSTPCSGYHGDRRGVSTPCSGYHGDRRGVSTPCSGYHGGLTPRRSPLVRPRLNHQLTPAQQHGTIRQVQPLLSRSRNHAPLVSAMS